MTVAFALLAIGVSWLQRSDYARGFVRGLFVATYIGAVLLMYLMTTDGMHQLGGAWGEENTASELRFARKRGLIWGSVHNVEVGGIDVDHIVIAPRTAIAIDSKWHFGELRREALERDTRRAYQSARKASSILRSAHVGAPMEVEPLVVVWGRGQREIPIEGIEYNGVRVLAGADLRQWLEGVRHGKVAQDNAEVALAALETFAARRRGKQPLPESRPVGSGIRI